MIKHLPPLWNQVWERIAIDLQNQYNDLTVVIAVRAGCISEYDTKLLERYKIVKIQLNDWLHHPKRPT